jgi:PleD family two-component response regulator
MNGHNGDHVRVLVVDSQAPRRQHLAATLRRAACDVTEAATPLEAIAHLGSSRAQPSYVAVADTVPSSIGDELRAYLTATHLDLTLLRMVPS